MDANAGASSRGEDRDRDMDARRRHVVGAARLPRADDLRRRNVDAAVHERLAHHPHDQVLLEVVLPFGVGPPLAAQLELQRVHIAAVEALDVRRRLPVDRVVGHAKVALPVLLHDEPAVLELRQRVRERDAVHGARVPHGFGRHRAARLREERAQRALHLRERDRLAVDGRDERVDADGRRGARGGGEQRKENRGESFHGARV